MADLLEDLGFVEGVYQLEQADPVLGGPPNLETGEGIDNWQAYQLASRTRYLFERLTGIGGDAALTDNCNTITRTGFYRFHTGSAGQPFTETSGHLIHVDSEDEEASQIAFNGKDFLFLRTRDKATGVWSGWERVWFGAYALDQVKSVVEGRYGLGVAKPVPDLDALVETVFWKSETGATGNPNETVDGRGFSIQSSDGERSQFGIFSEGLVAYRDGDLNDGVFTDWRYLASGPNRPQSLLAGNGYRIEPDGFITQWGIANQGDLFPISFPNNCAMVLMNDNDANTNAYAPSNSSLTNIEWQGGDERGFFIAIGY